MKNILLYTSLLLLSSQTLIAQVKCETLTSRNETFEGVTYTKYNVVDSNYMTCPQIKATTPKMQWQVKKTAWSSEDENNYISFIKKLGYSKCSTTDQCLSGKDNPLRSKEDMLFTHYSDCADFPYYLRSYFAYKMNLPFSMVSEIKQAAFTPRQQAEIDAERNRILNEKGQSELDKYNARVADLRYSRNGNYPVTKINVPSSAGAIRDFSTFGPRIMNQISSATLRMLNGKNGFKNNEVESDFYSPQITLNSIKPGTILYNVAGHVAVVYDVTTDGRILFFDAHPDNSITRGVFNPEFKLVNSVYGGNFKNFRPLQISNPEYDKDGNIIKGQLETKSDSEIPDFSLEQYVGNATSDKGGPMFKLSLVDNRGVDFYDWIKFRMSAGKYRLNPLIEMKNEIESLCNATQDRIAAVQAAVDNKIYLKPHPTKLPENIFGAAGEWEAYSTPGRDLRLKQKILSIPEQAKSHVKRFYNKDPLVVYTGSNLKVDLINTYKEQVGLCKISYQNSVGNLYTIPLEILISRVAKISYDPFDCPELRWGADTKIEKSTCTNEQEKMEWYHLQQFMRNNLEKDTSAVHGWTLEELMTMNEHKQVNNQIPEDQFAIDKKLQNL